MSNPPKPSRLKLVQGVPGHRPLAAEPAVASEIPRPPQYLSKAARREWRHVAPLLRASGLIAMQDREAFGRWCTLVAKVADYEKRLEREGAVLVAQSGYAMPNPLIAIINSASKQLVGLSDRFCMNPKARIGAHVSLKRELDEFDVFLSRGRDKSPRRPE